MMVLKYLKLKFSIGFEKTVRADVNPLFVLRSVLGKNLRSMSCISRQSECVSCMFNRKCSYAYVFETIVSKDNEHLPGTEKASHPFSLSGEPVLNGSEYSFYINLFGNTAEYLPYIYAAFVRAGKDGLFKERAPFSVKDVCVVNENGKEESILLSETEIRTDIHVSEWNSETYTEERNGEVLIDIRSPLRFKTGGKYSVDFDAVAFMQCLFRRAKTLCLLYGNTDDEKYFTDKNRIEIAEKSLRWKDRKHYSVRQQKVIDLGGVVGTVRLKGTFSPFEQALLELNRIVNGGKATNFGLGQIDYWTKWN